jgi:hypothetical protein
MPIANYADPAIFYAFFTAGGVPATGLTVTGIVKDPWNSTLDTRLATDVGDGEYQISLGEVLVYPLDMPGTYRCIFSAAEETDQGAQIAYWNVDEGGMVSQLAAMRGLDPNGNPGPSLADVAGYENYGTPISNAMIMGTNPWGGRGPSLAEVAGFDPYDTPVSNAVVAGSDWYGFPISNAMVAGFDQWGNVVRNDMIAGFDQNGYPIRISDVVQAVADAQNSLISVIRGEDAVDLSQVMRTIWNTDGASLHEKLDATRAALGVPALEGATVASGVEALTTAGLATGQHVTEAQAAVIAAMPVPPSAAAITAQVEREGGMLAQLAGGAAHEATVAQGVQDILAGIASVDLGTLPADVATVLSDTEALLVAAGDHRSALSALSGDLAQARQDIIDALGDIDLGNVSADVATLVEQVGAVLLWSATVDASLGRIEVLLSGVALEATAQGILARTALIPDVPAAAGDAMELTADARAAVCLALQADGSALATLLQRTTAAVSVHGLVSTEGHIHLHQGDAYGIPPVQGFEIASPHWPDLTDQDVTFVCGSLEKSVEVVGAGTVRWGLTSAETLQCTAGTFALRLDLGDGNVHSFHRGGVRLV